MKTATHKKSQEARLREKLEAATIVRRHPAGAHRWVSVSEIMRLGIAQHSARIAELRRHLREEGGKYEIVNYQYWNEAEGRDHSDYAMMTAEAAKAWRSGHPALGVPSIVRAD